MRHMQFENVLLIGFCSTTGPRSGKSFCARILQQGFGAIKASFAEPVKEVSHTIIRRCFLTKDDPKNLDKNYPLWVDPVTFENFTLRNMYQLIGTACFRDNVDKDIWVDILHKKIIKLCRKYPDKKMVVVIDDVRFYNEMQYIRMSGGYVFNILNTEVVDRISDSEEIVQRHEFLSKYTIYNNNTREYAYSQIYKKIVPLIQEFRFPEIRIKE